MITSSNSIDKPNTAKMNILSQLKGLLSH